MARTKIKRRTYNLGNAQQTENSPREAERVLVETPVQDVAATAPSEEIPEQEAPPSVCEDPKGVSYQGDAPASKLEENVFISENRYATSPKPQENSLETNDDSLAEKSPILGCSQRRPSISRARARGRDTKSSILGRDQDASDSQCQPSDSLADTDALTISRDSPLNLVWDSSMKENYQPPTNAPNFRPVTPDFMHIPVGEILSPNTQKEIRTSIRALFPNGPPPPAPVKPVRRPKKGDTPYIVGCTKRPRVASPKSLTVFRGDAYGITNATNCDEEDQCSPAKQGRRGPHSGMSLSKSRFNPQSNEIAERLKLYEKIDRLLGRTPKEESVGYMTTTQTTKRSFSPLPSTSTDSETIMKNDKHFSESLNCDNFDINDDDDEELPEVFLDTSNLKQQKNTRKPLTDNVLIEVNEDINNNNNDVIAVDDDFCEIQFDKYLPKEKILDYSDVEDIKPKNEPEVIDSIDLKDGSHGPPRDLCPRTSADVICVEEVFSQGTTSNVNTLNLASTSVLRASNKIATANETKQSDLVIEVPDAFEPLNMSRQVPVWNDVEFVSEVKTNSSLPNENRENISDIQIVSQGPSHSQNIIRVPAELSLQFLIDFESYTRRKSKKKAKRQKSKENAGETIVNNENTAPSVNQVQSDGNIMSQPAPSAPQGGGKRLGECPICLENFPTGSIASTNCGHVFCLDCIKQSLKTSGKKCPTCRKQLRGVGYHQVFL